jgi:hypothetical protein
MKGKKIGENCIMRSFNDKSRQVRWAGHVARMGDKRNAYKILVGKPEGKRPLGRPRHRWVDNIKMNLTGIGWDSVDWIDMALSMPFLLPSLQW